MRAFRPNHAGLRFAASAVALSCAAACAVPAPGLPDSNVALRVDGANLVDANGEIVTLRAINLGNWFLIEPWMLGLNESQIRDQATVLSVLRSRFGAAEADRLIGLHRDGWMTQRDFDAVAAAGFNAVRIPISHVMLESAPFVLDEAGIDRLRGAVAMASAAGLYVIFDMHSVPGGQSLDQPSGDATANDLWTDEEAQRRLAWLWQHVARRLKNEPNFVAYDLINEPYGDFSTDYRGPLVGIVDDVIEAIREIDPNRLILVPGTLEGIRFYGDPASRGWTNVGFTEHFYPGLFDGSPPTLGTQARFAAATLRDRADFARSVGAPYLWGEFNPVFERAGAPEVVRALLDAAEAEGVHAAVWSHKLVKAAGGVGSNNWYLTTNATPFLLGDIRTAPLGQIESAFASMATMPLLTDQAYADALTDANPDAVLPAVDVPPLVAPVFDAWPAWDFTDVGDVGRAGGQAVAAGATPLAADGVTLFAAGLDLFGNADSLRLAGRPMPPSYLVSGVFEAFEGGRFAQTGVTIRSSDDPGSAHLSLVVFGDGRVLVKQRAIGGVATGQRYIGNSGFPVGLAVGRSAGTFDAWMTDEDGLWREVPIFENPAVGTSPLGGFVGAANRPGPLSVFEIASPRVDAPGSPAPSPTLDDGTNLLTNASFETPASGGTPELAAGWSVSGQQMTRQAGWTPVRDGSALLAYRHWQVTGNGDSSAAQTVSGLTVGEPYVFTVYANRDAVPAGRSLAESIELRIETTGSPARWLESQTFDVGEIATGSRWSRLQVRFVATDTQHRVRIVASPGQGQRDGAVKFDGLHLERDD